MTLVAYLGDVPILGVPGAAISMPTTIFDVLLPQVFAGVRFTKAELTGLAEGGDGRYPEGTVWIGVAGPGGTITRKYHCDLGRKGNIRRFATVALQTLAHYIKIDSIV